MTSQVEGCTHPFIEPYNVTLDQFKCSVCKEGINSDRKKINIVIPEESKGIKIASYLIGIGIVSFICYTIWWVTH